MNTLRLKKIQRSLIHPILIKKKENLRYLTGQVFDHRAEEYLLITKNNVVAFGSGLEQIDWVKKSDRLKNIGLYLQPKSHLDIEYGFTYGEGEYLKLKIKNSKLKIDVKPERSAVDVMRMVKEPGEIALVKKSMQIVEQVFKLVRNEIKKPGMTEVKLAEFIKSSGLKRGAEDISFPPIVAAGSHAAIPHHVPNKTPLRPNQSIILDFGFKYKGYCSDFTRTVFLKSVPVKLVEAYNQVEKAYNECIRLFPSRVHPRDPSYDQNAKGIPRSDALIRNGKDITGNNVYQKAVSVLAEKKLDKYFIHSLGHGTGLEIHELPNISPRSKDVMKDGMVFSIEPGVYIPKVGGIRIEDLVYLEKGKIKKFINVPTFLAANIF